jgi:hypothetical protein
MISEVCVVIFHVKSHLPFWGAKGVILAENGRHLTWKMKM